MSGVRPIQQRGDKVRIPAGAYVRTTHPDGDRIAKRSQVVTVSHYFGAYDHTPAMVSWAGAGGYWCDAWEWEPVAAGLEGEGTPR